jgi:predicted nucleic acid-binding protein
LTTLIVDASATGPFILADEAQHQINAVADAIRDGRCIAPAIWPWEIANLIWKALRSGRMTTTELDIALKGIEKLSISIEPESVNYALRQTLDLANRYGLTAYDAAYLELAVRVKAELATYDTDLRDAALAEGIVIHPAP